MRRTFVALTCLLALGGAAGRAAAEPSRPKPKSQTASREVRFLGSTPGGPLAVVRNGEVRTPPDTACRSWGPIGSRWGELDAFGRVVAQVAVRARDYYDVSQCDELYFRRISGKKGVGVYVDASASYTAPTVQWWRPSGAAVAALDRVVHARQGRFALLGKPGPSVRALSLYFAWGEERRRFAAVGGKSLLILTYEGERWRVVHQEAPAKGRGLATAYRVLGVTDMNRDGRPELVVHQKESFGEWYGDATFTERADGTWKQVSAGIYGSTA